MISGWRERPRERKAQDFIKRGNDSITISKFLRYPYTGPGSGVSRTLVWFRNCREKPKTKAGRLLRSGTTQVCYY